MTNVDAKVLAQLKNLSDLPAVQLESLSKNLTVKAFTPDYALGSRELFF